MGIYFLLLTELDSYLWGNNEKKGEWYTVVLLFPACTQELTASSRCLLSPAEMDTATGENIWKWDPRAPELLLKLFGMWFVFESKHIWGCTAETKFTPKSLKIPIQMGLSQ